ncbi:monocarboxylate transporter 14 [Plakobranchus ocellatus]|uniref:Monocarboxylate transporter 14 n=1 Tax=Plakobranchus ocellatus TaxID=259542 RepID=A0AAV4BCI9_9GAST|nr:monocarboxylate transporter 14 [Plakobranchus ocellatus]
MEKTQCNPEDGPPGLSHDHDDDEPVKDAEVLHSSGIPIDRGWAWMTVLGCFGMHIAMIGGGKSIGVLLVEAQDRFNGVPSRLLGLVPGISTTFLFALGLVATMLSSRFTYRAVVFAGGLLACVGYIMTGFIDRFWLMYLTYSITCGVGFSLSYTPSLVFVGLHFKKRRSLANGLSLAGSGIGSFALPNLMRWMLNVYGWTGCCMVMGGIMLHVCACALLCRPNSNRKRRNRTGYNGSLDVAKDLTKYPDKHEEAVKLMPQNSSSKVKSAENSFEKSDQLENSTIYSQDPEKLDATSYSHENDIKCVETEKVGDFLNPNQVEDGKRNSFVDTLSKLSVSYPDLQCVLSHDSHEDKKPSNPPRRMALLTNPVMIIYILFGLLVHCAYPNIFFILPADAEMKGHDRTTSALLLSIIGITDLLGRLCMGSFADLKLVDRRYLLSASTLFSGALCLLLPLLTSFWEIAAFAIVYGFCAGAYVTLIPVVIADNLGLENLGQALGLVTTAMAVLFLPGPYLAGYIRDATGTWSYSFILLGTIVIIGSLFPLLQPIVQKCDTRRETN